MTDYNKFLLASILSWLSLVVILAAIFGPVLALMAYVWFPHWPQWATFLFNLGISIFVYSAPNTQYLKEEIEIKIRRLIGVKY